MDPTYVTLGGFVAIAALMVGLFAWLRADIAAIRGMQIDQGERLARIETTLTEFDKRLTRLEAGQIELRDHVGALETGQAALREGQAALRAGQTELREGQAAAGERMARIEGTVAGALGRPFPQAAE